MAKQNPTVNERSKVRLFFVEGDFAPGELRELTQAFTNAVRPAQVITRGTTPARLPAPAADGNGNGAGPDHDDLEVAETVMAGEEDDGDGAPTTRSAARKPRTYRKPVVLEIDLSAGEKPFEGFVKEKKPEGHLDRYLVVAAWFHDYAQTEEISVDHVYTCYKAMDDWTFDVSDPGWPFRKLKAEGRGTTNRGKFAIGYQGLATVKKMNSSS